MVFKKNINLVIIFCLSPNICSIFLPQVMLGLCSHFKEFQHLNAHKSYNYKKIVLLLFFICLYDCPRVKFRSLKREQPHSSDVNHCVLTIFVRNSPGAL